ncbi:hypothetical protein [Leifsonia sp. AG29]|uniref:hypothetical protein n=1 Tax=Leifsonia sp. AG29 TaxID=2598860 RepID=UPI00131CBDDB|nr:hypothetical protein [Leifsonia sp. AG29]
MTRKPVAAAFGAALALLLSGCAALGFGAPSSSPLPTSSVPPAKPAIDCASLTTEQAVTTLLGGPADPEAQPWSALSAAAARGPFAVIASGGGWCGWGPDPASPSASASSASPTAGAPAAPPTATPGATASSKAALAPRGVAVAVIPGAADAWKRLAAAHPDAATAGADYDGGVSLGGDCSGPSTAAAGNECHTNVLVGGSWVAVTAYASDRLVVEKSFHEFVQSLIPQITQFDKTAKVAATAPTLPCADQPWLDSVRDALGLDAVSSEGAEESFRQTDALLTARGMTLCNYRAGTDGSGRHVGTLSVIADGAQAYEQYRAEVVSLDTEAHAGSITVGGQQIPTLARTITAPGIPDATAVDAVVHGAWIEFTAPAADDDSVASYVQWVAGRL